MKAIQIDAIQGMKTIESNAVKSIITSPPYKYEEGYSDDLMRAIAQESFRVLKNDGILLINFSQLADDPQRHHRVALIFGEYFKVGSEIAWVKSMPELGGRFTPTKSKWWLNRKYETIFVFGKEDAALDRLAAGVPYRDKSNLERFGHESDLQCRGDVWFIPYENKTGKSQHPYQFPDRLCELMLGLSGVKTGDLVVDPFCGSAILGKKCDDLGVDFIGFDLKDWSNLDSEFENSAKQVIEQHKELLEKLGDLEVSDNKTILEMEKINKIKRDELTTLIVSYEATIGLLKETLEFYANENHYFDADIRSDGYVVEESSIDKDYGKLARKALSKIKWSTSNKKNL